jgi:hypothetical protein
MCYERSVDVVDSVWWEVEVAYSWCYCRPLVRCNVMSYPQWNVGFGRFGDGCLCCVCYVEALWIVVDESVCLEVSM